MVLWILCLLALLLLLPTTLKIAILIVGIGLPLASLALIFIRDFVFYMCYGYHDNVV